MSCRTCLYSEPGAMVPICRKGLKPSTWCDDRLDVIAMACHAAGFMPDPPKYEPTEEDYGA